MFSDAPVSSPLISLVGVVLVMDISQLGPYEMRVRPGGLLIVEEAGLGCDLDRKQATMQALQSTVISRNDIEVMKVPALDIAFSIFGSQQGSNLVLLGTYAGATQTLDPDCILAELDERLSGSPALAQNKLAFKQGFELGASTRAQT